jgi:hypothetical protein
MLTVLNLAGNNGILELKFICTFLLLFNIKKGKGIPVTGRRSP